MRFFFVGPVAALLFLLTPQAAVVAQFPSCSVCPIGDNLTLPDAVLISGSAGILDADQTCEEAEAAANAGQFSPAICALLRARVEDDCGCVAPPTESPTPLPTESPTRAPFAGTPVPTAEPTVMPTEEPTPSPTDEPTASPTEEPTADPTDEPTASPTEEPTADPTDEPTTSPADEPTASPTEEPTADPTDEPTASPTGDPATSPTEEPATSPTDEPTASPTEEPTTSPTDSPTMMPTMNMTDPPTTAPTKAPTDPVLKTLEGSVVLRLNGVPSEIKDDAAKATYKNACGNIYKEQLTYSRISCELSAQSIVTARRLRSLQDGGLSLDTTALIKADDLTGSVSEDDFEKELVDIMKVPSNSAEFVNLLKSGGSASSDDFYSDLESVEAYNPENVPVGPPVATPTPREIPVEDDDDDDDDGLSGGAIFGIIVAVAIGVGAVIGGVYYLNKTDTDEHQARPVSVIDPLGGAENPAAALAPAPKSAYDEQPVAPRAAAAGASVASASVDSSAPPPSDVDSREPTGVKSDATSTVGGASEAQESMSYAYSLDAGNVDQTTAAASSTKKSESGAEGTSQSGDEMSSHAMSSLRQNMVSRTVVAPPGKLGIVIDTTLEGPVVHKVNPQSPLEGTLFPGDIIVAIDDVDTRAMSASAITALMVRTANLRRKLTVLSEDVTN